MVSKDELFFFSLENKSPKFFLYLFISKATHNLYKNLEKGLIDSLTILKSVPKFFAFKIHISIIEITIRKP